MSKSQRKGFFGRERLNRVASHLNADKVLRPDSVESSDSGADSQELIVHRAPVSDSNRSKDIIIRDTRSDGKYDEYHILGNIITRDPSYPSANGADKFCVITDKHEIFVSKDHVANPHYLSYYKKLVQAQVISEKDVVFQVSLRTINDIYDKDKAFQDGSYKESDSESTKATRTFYDFISYAVSIKATDVHFVADKIHPRVEYRVNGMITVSKEFPFSDLMRLLSVAYNLCDVRDAQYLIEEPQSGRISKGSDFPSELQSLRLEWTPLVSEGRYLVVRVLPKSNNEGLKDLSSLGYSSGQLKLIKYMRQKNIGINIFSGPTSSGKSTSLFYNMEEINRVANGSLNILGIEDPPEFVMSFMKQQPVKNASTPQEKQVALRKAMSSSMRLNPDIMMLGEIRTLEAANSAFEGSMTGHQLWTTLHANSASDIILRLKHMGVDSYFLYNHRLITGLVAQRLVRVLCPYCRVSFVDAYNQSRIDSELFDRVQNFCSSINGDIKDIYHYSDIGCDHCKNTGFSGSTVVAEVIIPDAKFMQTLSQSYGSFMDAEAYWLSNRMKSIGSVRGFNLLVHGLSKMFLGLLSPEDVERKVDLIIYDTWMDELIGNGRPENMHSDLLDSESLEKFKKGG